MPVRWDAQKGSCLVRANGSDTYVSKIQGMLYTTDRFWFYNNETIEGTVASGNDQFVYGTLNMTNDPASYLNPPPGFRDPETIRILLNSAVKPLGN